MQRYSGSAPVIKEKLTAHKPQTMESILAEINNLAKLLEKQIVRSNTLAKEAFLEMDRTEVEVEEEKSKLQTKLETLVINRYDIHAKLTTLVIN